MTHKTRCLIATVLVTLIGYCTYFYRYEYPPNFFWDENYHIAHAQKYLSGVYFMEPHPPLGKLLIAAGEWLLDKNPVDSQFVGTDHAPTNPPGFSFEGYRFFPALLGWMTAPILLWCFVFVGFSAVAATALTGFFLFDTALIVHLRGAMLEGPQLFFVALSLLAITRLIRGHGDQSSDVAAEPFYARAGWYALLGLALGSVLAIKINGIVIGPLALLALWWERGSLTTKLRFAAVCGVAFCVPYLTSWYLHFALGKKIEPTLPSSGYYIASPEYKEILAKGESAKLRHFPVMFRDSMAFVPHYTKGVAQLNICKNDENGSYPLLWPLGATSINYRWENVAGTNTTRYLFIQANPGVWIWGLLGVIGALMLAGARLVGLSGRLVGERTLFAFLAIYLIYGGIVLSADRVLYLYHYFIPLIFSFFLFGLVVNAIPKIAGVALTPGRRSGVLAAASGVGFAAFLWFNPFAYYKPLSEQQVAQRSWLSAWDLHCASCSSTNPIGRPIPGDTRRRRENGWVLTLAGLRAVTIEQEWGDPMQDRPLVSEGSLAVGGVIYQHAFAVHAHSKVEFLLPGPKKLFRAAVALPDYNIGKGGSVVFQVVVENEARWVSPIVRPGDPPVPVSIDLTGVRNFALVASDAGDGNTLDHALWLQPTLE